MNYKTFKFCYIMLYFFACSNPANNNVSLLFMCRVCPDVDSVSLPDFDYHTAARAMVFVIRITIRTSATQVNRVYHEFRYYISVITAVKIPVEDLNQADWVPESAVIGVVGISNISDNSVKYHSVVQTWRSFSLSQLGVKCNRVCYIKGKKFIKKIIYAV